MSLSQPLVTVGICCFNAAETIERSVGAALKQSYPSFEVVVADDASTDDSANKVEALAKLDPRIRLIRRQRNGGVAETRNTIIATARGEFLMFQDDDDESVPERISRQMLSLIHHGSVGSPLRVSFVSRLVDDGVRPILSKAMGVDAEPSGDELALHIMCGDPIDGDGHAGAGTMMASLSVFRKVGMFDETFRRGEEQEWLVRFAICGGAVTGSKEPLLVQHVTYGRDKNVASNRLWSITMARKHRAFLRKHRAYSAALLMGQLRYHRGTGHAFRALAMLLGLTLVRPRVVMSRLGSRLKRRSEL